MNSYELYREGIENGTVEPMTILDNGGESIDRYTIIMDGAVYGMNDSPFNPCGFNQYCGETSNHPDDMSHCGEYVDIQDLPTDVQKAIAYRAGMV